jgi:hypothetical protein
MVSGMSTVDDWLAAHPEAAPLVSLVRSTAGLDEAVKWGRLTFTAENDWHHWVCAVAASKAGVNLVFHKGSLLPDPKALLTGDGRYTRQLPAKQALSTPDDVATLIGEAVARQRDML